VDFIGSAVWLWFTSNWPIYNILQNSAFFTLCLCKLILLCVFVIG